MCPSLTLYGVKRAIEKASIIKKGTAMLNASPNAVYTVKIVITSAGIIYAVAKKLTIKEGHNIDSNFFKYHYEQYKKHN